LLPATAPTHIICILVLKNVIIYTKSIIEIDLINLIPMSEILNHIIRVILFDCDHLHKEIPDGSGAGFMELLYCKWNITNLWSVFKSILNILKTWMEI